MCKTATPEPKPESRPELTVFNIKLHENFMNKIENDEKI